MNFQKFNIINEGGAYGHIMHPYEDNSLTFKDIKNIITQFFNTDPSFQATEKMDGVSLLVTWKNNSIRAARNKSHLANYGQNSLSPAELKDFFSNKQGNYTAFYDALHALNIAFNASKELVNKIFCNGRRFLSVEIIYPGYTNVIKYRDKKIIFHNIYEYDIYGVRLYDETYNMNALYNLLLERNLLRQNDFEIIKPNILSFDKNNLNGLKYDYFIRRIDTLYTYNHLTEDDVFASIDKVHIKDFFIEFGKFIIESSIGLMTDKYINKIPTEGLVFEYNGKTYKLTGDFRKYLKQWQD